MPLWTQSPGSARRWRVCHPAPASEPECVQHPVWAAWAHPSPSRWPGYRPRARTPRWATATASASPRDTSCRKFATRAWSSPVDSPPSGRNSSRRAAPAFSKALAPCRSRICARVSPSHWPQFCSISRASSTGFEKPSASAVCRARSIGLEKMRAGASASGRRSAAIFALPASLSGISVCPWMRPSTFHSVGPWRSSASFMPRLVLRPALHEAYFAIRPLSGAGGRRRADYTSSSTTTGT